VSNTEVKSLETQINAVNQEIKECRSAIQQIMLTAEAIELQIQNAIRLINEVHKVEMVKFQRIRKLPGGKNSRAFVRGSAKAIRSEYARVRGQNEERSEGIWEVRRMLEGGDRKEGCDLRWLVGQAIESAKKSSSLSNISDALDLPRSSALSSESLAKTISGIVNSRVEEGRRGILNGNMKPTLSSVPDR
jgi:hypothetical protein